MTQETNEEKLSRLERELKGLKSSFPEHCAGTREYISAHAASPAHWQKIEDLEEEIQALKAELGR
jgi:hypothetical protein